MKNVFRIGFLVVIAIVLAFSALSLPKSTTQACDGSCSCGGCSCSQEDTCNSQVISKEDAPTCGFNFGPANQGIAPFTVNLTNSGDKGLTVLWDFGDGSSLTGETVSHTYTATGQYTLRQMIVDSKGFICKVSETITVTAPTTETTASTPVVSSTAIVPQISTSNSANSASTSGDGSPIIAGNNNAVTITINPPAQCPSIQTAATETKTGFINAVTNAWKTFFQTLFGGKK